MAISFSYNHDYVPPAPFVEATICSQRQEKVYAFLDSGADVTMLPEQILHDIHAPHIRTRTLRGVTGHPAKVDTYLVEVQIGEYSIPGIQAVASRKTEAIIGCDVLQHLIVTLDGISSLCEIS
ncbi:MAG: retroviral-like aspartic protease family protein [Chloroflexota bacterium]